MVRPEPFSADASRAYVEGLLPKGLLRKRYARELGVDVRDGFGLLAELGRDCPGAIVFLPEGARQAADEGANGDRVAWLNDDEVAALATRWPEQLLGHSPDGDGRFALGGTHRKLALVRGEDGSWALPTEHRPSTHIVKPESGELPDMVANEAFCMAVAREAGLPVVDSRPEVIGGRPCLVVARFDRVGEGPDATRLHQEDLCQALGIPSSRENGDCPGFSEVCGLLRAIDRGGDIPVIVAAGVCNYLLGNSDANARNFALRFDEPGPRLAPLYDISSTVVYDLPVHRGMVLGAEYDSVALLSELARVSEECGHDFDAFRTLVAATASSIEKCLEKVLSHSKAEGWHAPLVDEIAALAYERSFGLITEVEY
jgi:serine/threonine-protein kinase HipA